MLGEIIALNTIISSPRTSRREDNEQNEENAKVFHLKPQKEAEAQAKRRKDKD